MTTATEKSSSTEMLVGVEEAAIKRQGSPQSRGTPVKKLKPNEHRCAVVRVVNCIQKLGRGSRILWYVLKVDEEYKNRTLIYPFMGTNHSLFSTIASVGSVIYVIGGGAFGYDGDLPSKEVFSFDMAPHRHLFDGSRVVHLDGTMAEGLDGWVKCPDMSIERSKPLVAVACGKLFVAGGSEPKAILNLANGGVCDPDRDRWFEVYDPHANSWSVLSTGKSIYWILNPNGTIPFHFTMAALPDSSTIIFCSDSAQVRYNAATDTLEPTDFDFHSSDLCVEYMSDTTPVVLGDAIYAIDQSAGVVNGYDLGTGHKVLGNLDPPALEDYDYALPYSYGLFTMLRSDLPVGVGFGSKLHLVSIFGRFTYKYDQIAYQLGVDFPDVAQLDYHCVDVFEDTDAPKHICRRLKPSFGLTTQVCIHDGGRIHDGLLLMWK